MRKFNFLLKDSLLSLLGIGLVGIGFMLYKNSMNTDDIWLRLPYLLIGIGCGICGHYAGNLLKSLSISNNEALKKQMQIEQKDERNILIAEKSKAKAYDLMRYLWAGMLIIFSIMDVDKYIIFVLVTLYLVMHIYALYWRFKYENKM